jgi:hypothetical protein
MTDREKIIAALREKPLNIFEVMKRVNINNQEDCQALLLKMRDEGSIKFDMQPTSPNEVIVAGIGV